MTILALDLGTNCGWATWDGKRVCHGVIHLGGRKDEIDGARFTRFRAWLADTNTMLGGALCSVFYEDVRRHIGTTAAHIYGGFWAHLEEWCFHKQIACHGFGVGEIKKHATGRGNADKNAVIMAMQAKGYNVTDDNEADALALLHLALDVTQEAA